MTDITAFDDEQLQSAITNMRARIEGFLTHPREQHDENVFVMSARLERYEAEWKRRHTVAVD